MSESVETLMQRLRGRVEARLDALLPRDAERPAAIHRAMRYSVQGGGKRLRPLLVLLCARACGGSPAAALDTACAVELLHTYTLIHDDLPCMDDDDLRRGRPSSHKVFGQALALLAGDGLLTEVFGIIASCGRLPSAVRAQAVSVLARAAGSRGVIAGQVEDIQNTGRARVTLATLRFIHRHKTADLIGACAELGAVTAQSGARARARMLDYGLNLGLAFQITDDILDITGEAAKLGKTPGKDQRDHKATYPAVCGLPASRRAARRHVDAAVNALAGWPGRLADPLRHIALQIASRDH